VLHGGHQVLKGVATAPLGSLVVSEPEYGSAKRGVLMKTPNDVKYIRITDFGEDGIPPGHEFVTAEEVEDRFLLKEGDILFARSGATVGKTYIYTKDVGLAIFAGYCIRFRFDPKKIAPWYVYFYTKTQRYAAWVRSMQRPAGQPNINKEEFKTFTIPVAAPVLQVALVKDLQAAQKARDAKLAQADALLTSIDDLVLAELGLPKPTADGRLAYAVRLNGIRARLNPDYYHPERVLSVRAIEQAKDTLRAARLEEIADFMRDIAKVSEDERYLGLASIEPNTGELTGEDETAKGLAFTFRKDDVLFSRLRPYLNKVRRAEEPGKCSTEFHVIRIKEGLPHNVLPEYLACVLRSSPILAQTRRMMTGNTHPRLANDDVVNLVVPIPAELAQKRIVAEVANRKEQVRRERAQATALWAKALDDFERKLLAKDAKP